MSTIEEYEIYAIRYAQLTTRQRHENFIVADPHDGIMPIDYYIWVIRNKNRTLVVDTGFDHQEAKSRSREIIRLPEEGLDLLGIDTSQVQDVIITHLHYDHAGTTHAFSRAKFHLQDLEMAYATSRYMGHNSLKHAYSVEHVVDFVRHLYADRIQFHSGQSVLAPGISLHHIGGHTRGLQSVRVFTKRGWVVLASDASHFYENIEAKQPFPIVYNVGEMLEGFNHIRSLADSDQHIIPGHDPLVMHRYSAPAPELEGIIFRLDLPPA